MKTYLASKVHGVRVTAASVQYQGSVTIGQDILDAAGMSHFEQVHVVNLSTGARWITYALPGDDGVFELNGGGARLGVVGDECIVMTYQSLPAPLRIPRVVFVGEGNKILSQGEYRA